MRVELIKSFNFEAAHERGGKLHGHSYIVELKCAGECDEKLGWLVDYGEISDAFDPFYKALDHRKLEDVEGLEDTSLGGIEAWLYERLEGVVPFFYWARVGIVGECKFNPKVDQYREGAFSEIPNVHFGFEAAHFLPNVPEAHKCRRMHGHSFRVAVCAEKSNSLEPFLERIHHALDRRCLNRIVGLENATSEHVARWIWEQLEPRGVGMLSVTVAETCTARCVYRGEKKEQGPDKQPEAAALQVGNG